jgi:AbiV family abortive infection protein
MQKLISMCECIEQTDQGNETLGLDALVADILAGKVSVFDLLRAAPSGDYWAFVQQMRLFHVLSRDPGILKQLQAEIGVKIAEVGVDDGAIARELARKDGARRFPKLVEERAQTINEQPSLLSGATFEICLEQYKALVAHVERMWADGCQFYTRGNYPLAVFFSILVIEEVGKLSRLAQDLMFYDVPRTPAQNGTVERSHRRKHFIGVVSGALINARLDHCRHRERNVHRRRRHRGRDLDHRRHVAAIAAHADTLYIIYYIL